MKTPLLLLIIYVISYTDMSSQDIFSEQTWELTEDLNNNGWVDQGDVILFQVDITYNGKVQETISVKNQLDQNALELMPKSVRIAKGIIVSGNKSSDKVIQIEDVILGAPWGYATLYFSAKVVSDPEEMATPITNHTILSTSIGLIASNDIIIPRRTAYASEDSNQLSTTVFILLGILALGTLLGFISKRFRIAKFAKAHA